MLTRLDIESPLGNLAAFADDEGIRALLFPGGDRPVVEESWTTWAVASGRPGAGAAAALSTLADQLAEYFGGTRREFDIALRPVGTPFQLAAWRALTEIPFASTSTYGDQAARMGDRNKARAVGRANGANPIPIVVPCHRVVGSDGSLTGFGGGIEAKAWLLDHEWSIGP